MSEEAQDRGEDLPQEPLDFARVVDNFRLAKDELVTYLGIQFLGGDLAALKAPKEFLLPPSDA